MMKMMVTADEAVKLLNDIPHNTCLSAIGTHWWMVDDENSSPVSFLWLYCWAMTGMNSEKSKAKATRAFEEIFGRRLDDINSPAFHEWARQARYRDDLTDRDLMDRLNSSASGGI